MAKIMIVDDDVELLMEIKELLTAFNFDVETITNSALVFEKACTATPDLIIMDLKMRPKSGFQLVDDLRNSPKTKRIPVIALTGFFAEKEHMPIMKMYGIKYAVSKPFVIKDFIAKVQAVLEENKKAPAVLSLS